RIADQHRPVLTMEYEQAARRDRRSSAFFHGPREVAYAAGATAGNDRDVDHFGNATDKLNVISLHRSIAVDRIQQDLSCTRGGHPNRIICRSKAGALAASDRADF